MFTLILLLQGTPYETVFVKVIAFTLNIDQTAFSLDKDDIVKVFFIWWLVLGTVLQILAKVTNIRFKNKHWLIILSTLLLALTIVAIIKTSFFVFMIFFYIISITSLGIYFNLSHIIDRMIIKLHKENYGL